MMLKLHLILCVGFCVVGLVCADCYRKVDFTCTVGSVEAVECYDCECNGTGVTSCCRKGSAMKPSGFPETCRAIFRKKSCSWKIVEKKNKRKPCDFNSGYVIG